MHRLLIQGGSEEIRLEEIERELAVQAPPGEPLVKQDLLALPLREAREQFERAYLQQQLLLCNGKVGQLAKRVGMERTHLYRKLRSLGRGLQEYQRGLTSCPGSEPRGFAPRELISSCRRGTPGPSWRAPDAPRRPAGP